MKNETENALILYGKFKNAFDTIDLNERENFSYGERTIAKSNFLLMEVVRLKPCYISNKEYKQMIMHHLDAYLEKK